jgi:hypothetical protein
MTTINWFIFEAIFNFDTKSFSDAEVLSVSVCAGVDACAFVTAGAGVSFGVLLTGFSGLDIHF